MNGGQLRVGLVGVGGIGRDQHLPGWAKVPFARAVALADLSTDAMTGAAERWQVQRCFSNWRELVELDDIDIVDICTPNRSHAEIAIAALQAGKHVLCEKPLATSVAEAAEMVAAAEKAGRLLMQCQHMRFDTVARQLKALMDAGTFGDIYYTRAQWLRRRLLPARPTFIERNLSGGGAILDIGVHLIDLAHWLLGAPEPVSVSAFATSKLARRDDIGSDWGDWDRQRFNVEEFASALIRFANGSTMIMETSWLGFQPEPEIIRLQSFGTRAGLVWPDGLVTGETNKVPWNMSLRDTQRGTPHHDLIAAFATAVRDGTPSPISPRDSLHVLRILDAMYRSAQTNHEVRLAQDEGWA